MAKDYAKNRGSGASRNNGGRGAVARRGNGGGRSGGGAGLWVGLMLGLAIGLATAGWVWINRPAKPSPLGPGAAVPAATVAPQTQKPIVLPPKQPSKYGFYEMLPSYEVVIPREEAAASVKSAKAGKPITPEIAEPGQYLIQVGAYKTRDEAERSRASLALLAVESKIEQVTVSAANEQTTWFRVRIGPQASLDKAQEIMQRLDENGIKGMLVKVKAN
jgi:cell division septation protein DedD